jgi:hypothetical protein
MNYYIFNVSNLKDYNSNVAYNDKNFFILINGHGGTNLGEKAASVVLKKIISYINLENINNIKIFKEAINFANSYLSDYALKNNLHKEIGASVGIYFLKENYLILNGGVAAICFNYNDKLKLFKTIKDSNIPQGFLGLSKKYNILEEKLDLLKEPVVILLSVSLLRFLTKEKIKNIIELAKIMYNSDFFCRYLAQNIFNEAKKLGFTQDASIIVVKN